MPCPTPSTSNQTQVSEQFQHAWWQVPVAFLQRPEPQHSPVSKTDFQNLPSLAMTSNYNLFHLVCLEWAGEHGIK